MSISVKTETLPIGAVPKNSIILLALTLGAFVVGSSEFMVGGLLNQIAADLNVPVPSAGLLITGYAAGVTVGGPLVTILTGRLDRKLQIALLLAIFILGNLVCALSTSFAELLIGRLVTAFCHGAYNGAAWFHRRLSPCYLRSINGRAAVLIYEAAARTPLATIASFTGGQVSGTG